MSLLTYEDARPWARSTAKVPHRPSATRPRAMPPVYREEHRHGACTRIGTRRSATRRSRRSRSGPTAEPREAIPPIAAALDVPRRVRVADREARPDRPSPERHDEGHGARLVGSAESSSLTGLTEDRYVAAIEMKEVKEGNDLQNGPGGRRSAEPTSSIISSGPLSSRAGGSPRSLVSDGRFTRWGVMPTSSIPRGAGSSRPVQTWCSRPRTCTRPAQRRRLASISASSSIRRDTSRRGSSAFWISPPRSTSTSGRWKPTRRSRPSRP